MPESPDLRAPRRKAVVRLAVALLAVVLVALGLAALWRSQGPVTKIAYFHGGRTSHFFRTYVLRGFEQERVNVELISKRLYDEAFHVVPKDWDEEANRKTLYGKVTGGDLIQELVKGNADGATVGECSFLEGIDQGLPLVAVAELGHDLKERPGHAIIFRRKLRKSIKGPADIKGRVLVSRRAGWGDDVFLREFLLDIGVDPDKDVKIHYDVMDDKLEDGLGDGVFDGGYFHLMALAKLVKKGSAFIYRRFDWLNPELSHALLVFRRDFLAQHRETAQKIVTALFRRLKVEAALPQEAREEKRGKGMRITQDFHGMSLPQCSIPPLVRPALLNEMQTLLIKHRYLKKMTDVGPYVDNSLVEAAAKELK